MLSGKLIQLIEDHWSAIARRFIRKVHDDPRLPHMSRLPESELSERAEGIVRNLGHWLDGGHDAELGHRFARIGRERCHENIPLPECLRALHLLKDEMITFVQDAGFAKTSVELYAEEELDRRIGTFFDTLVCHLAEGYEEALRRVPAHA